MSASSLADVGSQGKDGSRGLGMSSLNPEDAVSDYSTLSEKEMSVLDGQFEL